MREYEKCEKCEKHTHNSCNCKDKQKEKCEKCEKHTHNSCNCKVDVNIPTKPPETVVCNNICGNILLTDQIPNLEIWKESISVDATVTISVFNSTTSTALIRVLIERHEESTVEFTVPPGNTLSAIVADVESINVFQIGEGRTDGKFCLDVCFLIDKSKKHKKHLKKRLHKEIMRTLPYYQR